MNKCKKCGKEIDEELDICDECKKNEENEKLNSDKHDDSNKEESNHEEKKTVEDNPLLSIISYIGFLFFVPLLVNKDNKFYTFHANQGLILFILELIIYCVIDPIFYQINLTFGNICNSIFSVIILIYLIIGIVNVCNNKMNKLPLIGEITLIK